MRTLMRAAAGAAASLCLATSANAVVMQIDVYGTISGGRNDLDAFGTGGGSLTGKSVRAQFIFDTEAVGATSFSEPGHIRLLGGPNLMTSSVTVDGVTLFVDTGAPAGTAGRVDYYNNEPNDDADPEEVQYAVSSYNSATLDYRESSLAYFSFMNGEILINTAFSETFDVTGLTSGDTGYFEFSLNDVGTKYSYSTERVVASRFAAAPEPGTWALMIAGFGATGAMLRRRRTAAA